MHEVNELVDAWVAKALANEPELSSLETELADHLYSATESLMHADDLSAEQAFHQAAAQFGSPSDLRSELRKARPRSLVFTVAPFLAISFLCSAAMFWVNDITWIVIGYGVFVFLPYGMYTVTLRKACGLGRS